MVTETLSDSVVFLPRQGIGESGTFRRPVFVGSGDGADQAALIVSACFTTLRPAFLAL